MNNDKLDKKYQEIFQDIKEEKMDWDFEDFLKKAETSEKDEKIIPIATKQAKPSTPKFFWMAASVAIIAGIFFLINPFGKNKVEEQDNLVKTQILNQKNNPKNDFLVINETENQDSTIIKEKDSIVQNIAPEKEAEEVMNKILPKRGRMKKMAKQRYASNDAEPKIIINNNQNTVKPAYQDNFVIINGQKIENEKEAIDVAKYSLQMLSRKVSQTVAKTEPVTDIVEF